MGRFAQRRVPIGIFVLCASVYALTAGPDRLFQPSPNNHYVHLAQAWIDGRLDIGATPPGTNDWACFDTVRQTACGTGASAASSDADSRRWFVSFPPFPAAVIAPVVAVFGLGTWDRLFWIILAGLAPALLFCVLAWLREAGRSGRRVVDDVLLTALFAFGTVYYFAAVQGTVWFAAHVVASVLICLYLWCSFDARHPLWAGTALGLCFLTRPTTALLALFFCTEAIRVARDGRASNPDTRTPWSDRLHQWLAPVAWDDVACRMFAFCVPLLIVVGVAAWHNYARFGDMTEFGHRFLQVRWQRRIETWGLFGYHYLPRNLAVVFASLPWLLDASPYIRISRHGLALWFTTPNLWWNVWPRRVGATWVALIVAALPVAAANLLYQNTGWVQFGYRFALDYMPLLIVALALGGHRFGRVFWCAAVFAIGVNTFGAVTFDRMPQYYDTDRTQRVLFQPD